MMEMLHGLPPLVLLLLILLIGALPSGLFLALVRRRFKPAELEHDHEVAGFTFSVVGVLYAVLLAFIVLNVWEDYTRAQQVSEAEGSCLANLHRDSYQLPATNQVPVRQALIDYARAVVEQEWPELRQRRDHPAAIAAMNRIWEVYYAVNPVTDKEKIWYGEAVGKLNQLADLRRQRILAAKTQLSWIMWVLLIAGGVITAGFMNFFGVERFGAHLIMTVSLACLIVLILYIVFSLDNPFWGTPHIDPDVFLHFLSAHPVP